MNQITTASPAALPWTPEEISQLLAMRRQGMKWDDIAHRLNKTNRSVMQKFLKLVPSTSPKRKKPEVEMTEGMKIKLLSSVARRKHAFWVMVAGDVGEGATAAQCEEIYNSEISRRG